MKHEKCVWYLEYLRLKKYRFLFAKSLYFLIWPLGIFVFSPLAGMATTLFYLMNLIATRIIIIIILHIY